MQNTRDIRDLSFDELLIEKSIEPAPIPPIHSDKVDGVEAPDPREMSFSDAVDAPSSREVDAINRLVRSNIVYNTFRGDDYQNAESDSRRGELVWRSLKDEGFEIDRLAAMEMGKQRDLEEVLGEQFGTAEGLARKAPVLDVVLGKGGIANLWKVSDASERIEAGTHSEGDLELLADFQEYLTDRSRDKTFWAGAAEIGSESIPFAIEFLLSGGAISLAKKAIKKTAQEAVETAVTKGTTEVAKKATTTGITRIIRSAASETAKAAGKSALRLPMFSHRIEQQRLERMLPEFQPVAGTDGYELILKSPGQDLDEALANATLDVGIEIFSESTGEVIGVIARPVSTILEPLNPISVGARELLKRLGYHGIPSEIGEEYIGEALRQTADQVLGSDVGSRYPNLEEVGQMAAGFAAMPTGVAAGDYLLNRERNVDAIVDELMAGRGLQEGVELAEPVLDVVSGITQENQDVQQAETQAPTQAEAVLDEEAPIHTVEERAEPQVKPPLLPPDSIEPPTDSVRALEQPPVGQTSLKNRVVDQERKARGLQPITSWIKQTDQAAADEAERILDDNPLRGEELVAEFTDDARPPTKTESAVVLMHRAQTKARHIAALEELHSLMEESGADLEEAQAKVDILDQKMEEIDRVARGLGSQSGLSLQARKMMIDEEFDVSSMVLQGGGDKGSPLTNEETKQVGELASKHAKIQAAIEENEKQAEQAVIDKMIDQTIREAKKTRKRPSRSKKAKQEFDDALQDFFDKGNTLFSNPIDIERVKSGYRLAKAFIKLQGAKFQDFIDAVTQKMGELSDAARDALEQGWKQALAENRPAVPEEFESDGQKYRFVQKLALAFVHEGMDNRRDLVRAVHEALNDSGMETSLEEAMHLVAGYGNFKPLDKDESKARLRDIRGQLQQVSKLIVIRRGEAPSKSGVEQREPSDEERRLIQRVNEYKKKYGVETVDPARQLKSSLDAIKTRLKNQIKDLEQQIKSRKKIVKKRSKVKRDAEVLALEKKRDKLKEEFDQVFGPTEMTDEQRVAIAEKALLRSIADLKDRIKKGDISPRKRKSKTPDTPELDSLRSERDSLQQTLSDMRDAAKPKMTAEELATRRLESRLKRGIAYYKERIQNDDYAPAPPPPAAKLTKRGEDLRFELENVKKEWRQKREAWRRSRRTVSQKIFAAGGEAFNVGKLMLSTGEFSIVLRQGLQYVSGHPIGAIKRGIPKMLSSFASEKGLFRLNEQISSRENAKNGGYARMKIPFTDPSGKLNKREEEFVAQSVERIPVLGRIIKSFNRAASAFLNVARADIADALLAAKGGEQGLTKEEAQWIGKTAGIFTGRGDFGKHETSVELLSYGMWTPRWVLSRFQYLIGLPAYRAPKRFRKAIAKEYARQIIGSAIMMSLLSFWSSMRKDDDDDYPVFEHDPRSSDFLKVRFGNTRVDMFAGLQQVVVLAARIQSNETKTRSGNIIPLEGGFSGTAWDTASRFLRTKLHPTVGAFVDIKTGKDLTGRPVTMQDIPRRLLMPLAYQDVYHAIREHGIPDGEALGMLGVFGMGVNTYISEYGDLGTEKGNLIIRKWNEQNRDDPYIPREASASFRDRNGNLKYWTAEERKILRDESAKIAAERIEAMTVNEDTQITKAHKDAVKNHLAKAREIVRKRLLRERSLVESQMNKEP